MCANEGLQNNKFWGMIVYEIKGDGCLMGLWTNNYIQIKWTVRNEIARKLSRYKGASREVLEGEYSVVWIEEPETKGKSTSGKLMIEYDAPTKIYTLTWDATFLGKGFLIDDRLVVTYWKI